MFAAMHRCRCFFFLQTSWQPLKSLGARRCSSKLNDHKADAIQKLGFLSDEKSMAPAIPTEGGKISMIPQLRRSLPFYDVVEEFREGLGMTKMPELDTIRDKAFKAAFARPKPISLLYPQPQTRGDNHYFQLINHTGLFLSRWCAMGLRETTPMV